jgi:hypothetical protein
MRSGSRGSGRGMTQWAPMDPFTPGDRDGIPAADPCAGAPEPAPGFGIAGEEPDQVDPTEEVPGPGSDDGADRETPFRTPDPDDVSRR